MPEFNQLENDELTYYFTWLDYPTWTLEDN